MDVLIDMLASISDAFIDVEKLPVAMICAGGSLAAAGLKLVINKAPTPRDDDVFLHRRETPLHLKLYYATLIAVVMFGLIEAFAGVWLITVRGDLTSHQAIIEKAILGISIVPLIIVAGLGGFA